MESEERRIAIGVWDGTGMNASNPVDEPTRTDERLRRCERLSLDRDFQAAFRAKWSAAGARIVVYGLRNDLGYNRLGLVVGRRMGTAAVRNRFKRVVRDAFRRTKARQPQGWDWIVLPRLAKKEKGKPAATTSVNDWSVVEIRKELLTIMRQLGGENETRGSKRAKPSRSDDGR